MPINYPKCYVWGSTTQSLCYDEKFPDQVNKTLPLEVAAPYYISLGNWLDHGHILQIISYWEIGQSMTI